MAATALPGVALATSWVLLTLLAQPSTAVSTEERLIGWRGEQDLWSEELWDPLQKENARPSNVPLPASRGFVQLVSWKPRVFIYHNLISDVEAKHLVELAAPTMKRSTVVGAGGKSVEDDYRTSYGTFLRRCQDKVVERIENRVAAFTHLPVEHQEDLQILRYGIGQFYKVHSDTLRDDEAGVRVATVLIYLNDPDEGGETAFPSSEWVDPTMAQTYGSSFSECAKGHVAFKPKRGDALLFWSISPDGNTEDFHAAHTGCPVIKGVKWTATKWIHAKPFRPQELQNIRKTGHAYVSPLRDPGQCRDEHSLCKQWAARGDCENNRDYMVVGVVEPGVCRKTCGACTECAPGDQECINENRRRIGFLVFNPSELRPFNTLWT